MSYSHRIFIYAPVGLLVLLAVLWSVYWRVQADTLAARLDGANGGEIVPGIVFAFADKSIGGYPFRLDAVLEGVTFAHRGMEGETAWRTEKLAIHAMTYGRRLYLLEAAGLQSFARPPLAAGQPPRVTFVTPALARASAIVEQGRLTRFDIDLIQPQAKEASLDADATRTFGAARAQLHLIRRAGDIVDVALRIDGAKIGEGYKPSFGGDLKLIELRGKLTQAQTLDQLEAGSESVFDGIEHWRNAMGALAVDTLTLDWGPVKTTLTGAVGLDESHDPSGRLTGVFDASEVLGSFMRGTFSGAPLGQLALTLEFKDGDIEATAGSAAAAPAPAGTVAPATP